MISSKLLSIIVFLTSLTTLILSSIIIGSINADSTFKNTRKGKDSKRSATIILIASIFGVLASGSFLFLTETDVGKGYNSKYGISNKFLPKSYIF